MTAFLANEANYPVSLKFGRPKLSTNEKIFLGSLIIVKAWCLYMLKIDYTYLLFNNDHRLGSGCGAVGRAVAYDTRGPGFEYSHRQLLFEHLFTVNCL